MDPTLADVMPSVAAAFGIDGPNPLALGSERDVVVLLVDGLGSELVARSADDAPTLAAHIRATLRAGFPATTATSLTSLAVGAPCAVHGVIGYSFAVRNPETRSPRTLNALRWRFDTADGPDARDGAEPESVQPVTSVLQRLAASEVDVHYVVPGYQARSGLTRAAFRATGVVHEAADLDEVRDGILAVARGSSRRSAHRRFAYAYYPGLDMAGHLHGPESPEWHDELRAVDAMVADLFSELPPTCTLLVTGDHGMISAGVRVDLDATPDLHRGVRTIAGEARVRHVYLDAPTARADIVDTWTGVVGDHARIATREQAFDERWFGPQTPGPGVAERIGDVIAVAQNDSVLIRPESEPMESAMIGHHGAWTADEQFVPLVVNR
ncbi:alkaline phosphatase family protein [Gordonia sp. HY002]|uniref:alkaline phosphatase family protein n=1 Tax=Gordonia zhenghanii TaxID=2911516 RepID=UPI001EF11E90|nr:nucleotide pyrophosphatase/phosphodiesterase family protein [Gordonia zhenghanii]MCF8571754.1 alkaline phosphatase family protein [Gordonia zhenghanii]MCF8604921.1 alkaline phosphatase family protein [Gordonia zhenghanii]